MIGLAVLACSAALLFGANVLARSLALRALGIRGSTLWIVNAPFRWIARGASGNLALLASSAIASYAMASLLVTTGLILSGKDRSDETTMRATVGLRGPAARAGMRDGDRVLAVDGAPVANWDALKRAIHAHAESEVDLTIERDGATLHIGAIPNAEGKIMIGPASVTERVPLGVALGEGFATPARVWVATARGMARMLAPEDRTTLSGPVAIVRETNTQAEKSGIGRALMLAGALAAYGFPVMLLYASIVLPARRPRRP